MFVKSSKNFLQKNKYEYNFVNNQEFGTQTFESCTPKKYKEEFPFQA